MYKKMEGPVHLPELFATLKLHVDGDVLLGTLVVPENPVGLVIMPQPGTGGHESPRANYVARWIRAGGFATLVCELVGPLGGRPGEGGDTTAPRLATRLLEWVDLLAQRPTLAKLPIGLATTGPSAAAAVIAAVRRPGAVRGIVSYAGRMELAWTQLSELDTATLMIVAENDAPLMRSNRHALGRIRRTRRLEVIRGAHHRFEEPGALTRIASLTRSWLRRHVVSASEERPAALINLIPYIANPQPSI